MDKISFLKNKDPEDETLSINDIVTGKIPPEMGSESPDFNYNAPKHAKGNTSTSDNLNSHDTNTNGVNVFFYFSF